MTMDARSSETPPRPGSRRMKIAIGCGLAAVVLFAVGVFGVAGVKKIVQKQVDESLAITDPRSELYNMWQDPGKEGVPIYMSYYVFNVTNADDVVAGRAAPNLQELGPYVYRENRVKPEDSISWRANGTVQYAYHETFDFMANMSSGKESDRIVTVNMALQSLQTYIVQQFPIGQVIDQATQGQFQTLNGSMCCANEGVFVTKTVDELLWGYNDAMIGVITSQTGLPNQPVALQNRDDPNFYSRPSEQWTGSKPSDDTVAIVGELTSGDYRKRTTAMTMWSGKRTLDYWGSPYANMINGTDATQFHSDVQNDDVLQVFVDTLYRSTTLSHEKDVTVKGVPLKRFGITPSELISTAPDNRAFNMPADGFLPLPADEVSSAVWLTKPHFLDADTTDVHVTLDGAPMQPTKDVHDTQIDIEPFSGATFHAAKRLQMNVYVGNTTYTDFMGKEVPYTVTSKMGKDVSGYVPLFWADEVALVDDKTANDFKHEVLLPYRLGWYGGWVLIAVSILLFAGAVYLFLWARRARNHVGYETVA